TCHLVPPDVRPVALLAPPDPSAQVQDRVHRFRRHSSQLDSAKLAQLCAAACHGALSPVLRGSDAGAVIVARGPRSGSLARPSDRVGGLGPTTAAALRLPSRPQALASTSREGRTQSTLSGRPPRVTYSRVTRDAVAAAVSRTGGSTNHSASEVEDATRIRARRERQG